MALEWLKAILGEAYTEDADKKISEEIGKGFVARGDFNTVNEAKKALEAQLKDAGAAIETFKGMDVEAIRAAADKYKSEAEQARKDADAKIAAFQFDALLDGAIRDSKGRSAQAVKALLEVDTLRASKNQSEDIKAALAKLQTEHDYLFEPAAAVQQPYAAGTGSAAMLNTSANASEIAAIRAAAELKPSTEKE